MQKNRYIIATLFALLGAQVCIAQDFTYQGINYRVVDAEKLTCETKPGVEGEGSVYNGVPGNIVEGVLEIPAIVSDGSHEYNVIGIGHCGFLANANLTALILPEGLEYIADYEAFYGCINLTSITFPSSLRSIGNNAFAQCDALRSVVLNQGLQSLATQAFAFCDNLEEVSFPDNLLSIGHCAFQGCSKLKSVILKNGLESVEYGAFRECDSLRQVSLPGSLNTLEDGAFLYCPNISTIEYSALSPIKSFENVFDGGVYQQAELKVPNANLSYVMEVTPWNLFNNIQAADGQFIRKVFTYEGLTYSVVDSEAKTCITKAGDFTTQPGNVWNGSLTIPAHAYDGTEEYTVVGVGANGFCQNSALTDITLPNTIKSIGTYAFHRCTNLTKAVMPDQINEIGEGAFSFCESLPEILLPDSVSRLNEGTFEYCRKLKSVKFPKKLTYISSIVFMGCALDSITLPEGLREIWHVAFGGCESLKYVSLPASLTEIGDEVFKNCPRLTSIVYTGDYSLYRGYVNEIGNPNVLLYVKNKDLAPYGKPITIVEMNPSDMTGPVCRDLIIHPGGAFGPAIPFTALKASFTKSFTQATPVDGCGGWETVVLPFDVQSVTVDDSRGELTPFARFTNSRTQYPFWLYEADANSEWKEASEIKAGVPYLIAMPNNEKYAERFRINGDVTFSSTSPVLVKAVSSEDHAVTWSNGHTFKPLWLPLDEEQADNAMGLNANIDNLTSDDGQILLPGSAFHIGVEPKPLEAYVTRMGTRMALPVMGAQSHVAIMEAENDLVVEEFDGALLLKSATDRVVSVYRPDGVCVASILLKAGEPSVTNSLPQGLYIVAGRKIIIK